MKKLSLISVFLIGFASIAQAQATRTWVSGVGDDVNPCSRTAPCKTYAGAISKTAAGGVISTLDPGGFGAVTITKSITIDGSEQIAGILASGTTGVILSSVLTASNTVILRGLEITGAGTGIDGVRMNGGGNVIIEHCRIAGFTNDGVKIAPGATALHHVTIRNSEMRSCLRGVEVATTGLATVALTIEESSCNNNSANGVDVAGNNNSAAIFNSSMSNNGAVGFQLQLATSTAYLEGCLIASNPTGITAGISGAPEVRLSRNTIVGNTTAGLGGTGTTRGFGSNMIIGNGGSNSVTVSVASQ